MQNADAPLQIAILGAGLIGTAWAALFQHHGADVRVWDPVSEALAATPARMATPLMQLAEITPDAGSRGTLSLCDTLAEAATGADLIQENAPEDILLKHALFAQVERLMGPGAVLA